MRPLLLLLLAPGPVPAAMPPRTALAAADPHAAGEHRFEGVAMRERLLRAGAPLGPGDRKAARWARRVTSIEGVAVGAAAAPSP